MNERKPKMASAMKQKPKEAAPMPQEVPVEQAVVELTFANVPEVNFPLHIDTRLSRQHSNVLRRIAAGADKSGARLASGRPVYNVTDALKWLLEQCDDAIKGGAGD
jgi:hypothetical protein